MLALEPRGILSGGVVAAAALLIAGAVRAQPAPAPSTAPASSAAPSTSASPPTQSFQSPAAPSAAPQPSQAPQPAPPRQPAQAPPPPGYAPYSTGYPPPRPPPPKPKPKKHPIVTLTFSPLHLILPIFELTAEATPIDHFGIAAIGGYGSIGVKGLAGSSFHFKAYEVGGHLVGYPLPAHPFDSLEFGAELLYARVVTDQTNLSVSATSDGLAIGPFIGYKLLTHVGFTFVAQGGFEYVTARAHAQDTAGNGASNSANSFIPLVNLNIGWSF